MSKRERLPQKEFFVEVREQDGSIHTEIDIIRLTNIRLDFNTRCRNAHIIMIIPLVREAEDAKNYRLYIELSEGVSHEYFKGPGFIGTTCLERQQLKVVSSSHKDARL